MTQRRDQLEYELQHVAEQSGDLRGQVKHLEQALEKVCTTELVYYILYHANENTARQKPGKLLHVLRYATGNMPRVVFHSTFPSFLARNSYVCWRPFDGSPANVCGVSITPAKFSYDFRTLRRIPKIFRKFKKTENSSKLS